MGFVIDCDFLYLFFRVNIGFYLVENLKGIEVCVFLY